MNLTLDPTIPARAQIAGGLKSAIREGRLALGSRLPSGRDLAEQLGVKRATVAAAYQDLQRDGWVEAGVGRGTFVLGVPAGPEAEPAPRPLGWDGLRRSAPTPSSAPSDAGLVPLGQAIVEPAMFPTVDVRDALDGALERLGEAALDYPGAAGHEPLRERLADRLAGRGIDMQANQLLITGGSQQGLDLVARLMVRTGDAVLTSRPAFHGALEVLRGRGARCIGVALDAHGLVPDALASSLETARPRLLYTIPFCHNPTGVSATAGRLATVSGHLAAARLPVLEDDWLGDLRGPDDPAPLKVRDRLGQVLYLGTISKVLCPGLRIGWLVVPRPLFGPLVALKRTADLAGNGPGQAALAALLADGRFDRHVAQLRGALDRRRRIATDALARHLPAEIRLRGPSAGLVLWLDLPPGVDVARVVAEARQQGISITGGGPFDPDGLGGPGLRLSYARAPEDQLAPAIRTLGTVLADALRDARAPVGPPLV